MFSPEVYSQRRNKLKAALGSGLILLQVNEETGMNYKDNVYHFRQDSTFLYFAGIDRPGLFLLIDIDNNKEILFGNDLTLEETIWTGPQPKLSVFADKAGIAEVQSLSAIVSAI